MGRRLSATPALAAAGVDPDALDEPGSLPPLLAHRYGLARGLAAGRAGWRSRAVTLAALATLWACADDPTRSTDAQRTPVEAAQALSISSSNFQQCANGGSGGEPCFYINGVLNDSKSLYRESDVIAELPVPCTETAPST